MTSDFKVSVYTSSRIRLMLASTFLGGVVVVVVVAFVLVELTGHFF